MSACWQRRRSIRWRGEPGQNENKKEALAPQDLPEIVAGSGEQRIHAIAVGPEQIVPVEASFCLHVADSGLDR